jgi:hypothetical protein
VPARQARERLAPLPGRVAEVIRTLPDHSLLDRIVRGRTWILLLGVMLAGIVAMQVELLKLNASVGRSLQLGTALQSRNELLRASVSSLSDAQRIERLASGMGMVLAGPTAVQFLGGRPADPGRAAANIRAPDATTFQTSLQALLASASANSGQGGAATSGTPAGPPGIQTAGSATAAPLSSGTSSQTTAATTTQAAQTPPAGGAGTPAGGAGTPAGGAGTPIGGAGTPAGGAATPAGAVTPTGAGSPHATSTATPSG